LAFPGAFPRRTDVLVCLHESLLPPVARRISSLSDLMFKSSFQVSLPGFRQTLLLGFQRSPIHRQKSATSTPASSSYGFASIESVASACPCHGTGPVSPSRFLAALTLFSVSDPAGLLHPAADPGFATFWGHHASSVDETQGHLPRRTTLRSFFLCNSHPPFRISALLLSAVQGQPNFRVFFRCSSPPPFSGVAIRGGAWLPWVFLVLYSRQQNFRSPSATN